MKIETLIGQLIYLYGKYQISTIKNVESTLRDDENLNFALCLFTFDFFSIGGRAWIRLAYVAI